MLCFAATSVATEYHYGFNWQAPYGVTSLTGLALLVWRDTTAMALLLAVHLGVVMALFLTLPYGKFAHGIFRSAALLKWAIEKRQPTRLQVGE